MTDAVRESLFQCWNKGFSIRATMESIRRLNATTLTFEEVRLHFVDLSERLS